MAQPTDYRRVQTGTMSRNGIAPMRDADPVTQTLRQLVYGTGIVPQANAQRPRKNPQRLSAEQIFTLLTNQQDIPWNEFFNADPYRQFATRIQDMGSMLQATPRSPAIPTSAFTPLINVISRDVAQEVLNRYPLATTNARGFTM